MKSFFKYSFSLSKEFFSLLKRYPHLKQYKVLKNQIEKREQIKLQKDQLKDFTFLSANFKNFLPHISDTEYRGIYMNLLLSRSLLSQEIRYPNLINELNIVGVDEDVLKQSLPVIFCTYHLGSYRAIIGILVKLGIDFGLVVDRNTYFNQGDIINHQVEVFKKTFGSHSSFEIINAEDGKNVFQLVKKIRGKKSLVIYIDGNTGSGGIYKKDDRFQFKIPFLNAEIYSRQGIAAVAIATKRPIIPVVSTYLIGTLSSPKVEFLPPIAYSGIQGGMKEKVLQITCKLYSILESYLMQYYDQWEGWFYLHKHVGEKQIEKPLNTDLKKVDLRYMKFSFNKAQFGLFKMEQDCYMLNKETYRTHQISVELYEVLKSIQRRPFSWLLEHELSESFIEELYFKGVLTFPVEV